MRRAVLRQQLEEPRAWLALEDLHDWPIDRIAHMALLREAWQHRHHVSAYDALYVAAARVYDASLLTANGPLTRAPALGIVVQNIRMGSYWRRRWFVIRSCALTPHRSVAGPAPTDCRTTRTVVPGRSTAAAGESALVELSVED